MLVTGVPGLVWSGLVAIVGLANPLLYTASLIAATLAFPSLLFYFHRVQARPS